LATKPAHVTRQVFFGNAVSSLICISERVAPLAMFAKRPRVSRFLCSEASRVDFVV